MSAESENVAQLEPELVAAERSVVASGGARPSVSALPDAKQLRRLDQDLSVKTIGDVSHFKATLLPWQLTAGSVPASTRASRGLRPRRV